MLRNRRMLEVLICSTSRGIGLVSALLTSISPNLELGTYLTGRTLLGIIIVQL